MKIYQILIFSFFIFNSCKKENRTDNQIAENGNRIVYNQETWYELWKKDKNVEVVVIDTTCINQRKRARNDIEKGKMTYFYYMGMFKMYRSNTEMTELLSEHNIGIDSTLTTCFAPVPGFEYYCYEKEMQSAINKKYGKDFIDSLRLQAEKTYVSKHPNKIYKFEDCDTIARYPSALNYKEHFDNYEIDYFKNFKYPKGYKFKNEKSYSYTTADFILHKDGSIDDIVVETTFQNSENEKYRELFDKRMTEFIKKTEWIPAKSAGITVNSEMPIYVSYK
ncbi:hypothetical protein H3Z83_12710 [Tenacibaculum sp. S7007]|uniref:Uncharacterized protein n=1 Tax=Tenacibaculum pelagium TaxID=2759527 RepID=A0A839AUU5_9FLAO|nr:hypothetical protein [Tenacibaculum pelagium]MBA6157371.1 hypothetical protein [Tenacibaculum pelagium]